jgi:hypothetical protein
MWVFLQSVYSSFKVIIQIASLIAQICTFGAGLLEKLFEDRKVAV